MGKGSSERSLEGESSCFGKALVGNESEGKPGEMKRLRDDGDSQAAMKIMKVRTTRIAV